MKLSIIIVNYNVKYFLEQCLDAVLKATKTIKSEVFVVDNDSSDNSVMYLQPKFPQVIFIENKNNPGFAKANNQAILLASGEYILLLNPDTIIGENTLIRTCEFMDCHPDAGALGLKMIDGTGVFLPESKRGFPSPWNSFCKIAGLNKLFPKSPRFAKYHLRYLHEDQTHEVDVLAGAFMLIRKNALEKSGLLDESFFMYGEDIDLSYRITQQGYKNYYLPEKIIHYKGESTKKDMRYIRIFYDAMLIFFRKYYPHYHSFFRLIVYGAVYFRAFLAIFDKVFIPNIQNNNKDKHSGNVLLIGTDKEMKEIKSVIHPGKCTSLDPVQLPFDLKYDRPDEIVFCANRMSYQEIINVMSLYNKKIATYRIYHPDFGTLISPNEVLIYQP